ncbi:hypothetical protein H5T88_05190 [bacterium]|nr:hypothetical protein [bacterium]
MVSKTENGQTTTYVYNFEDKMVQVNLTSGASIFYNYDHEGKRIGKTMDGTTKDYYFDGDDLIIEAQGENILAYYTQGQGLISQHRNNASYFYHYDGLGSTKALTDANQNIQSSTIYDAWGNILQATGTITNPYLYVGELGYYGDAGMYLLTQRWYNLTIGRFVVRDQSKEGVNYYLYAFNNSLIFVDPTGYTTKSYPDVGVIGWTGVCDSYSFVVGIGGIKGHLDLSCVWRSSKCPHKGLRFWVSAKYSCFCIGGNVGVDSHSCDCLAKSLAGLFGENVQWNINALKIIQVIFSYNEEGVCIGEG